MKMSPTPLGLGLLVAVLLSCAGNVSHARAASSPKTVSPLTEQMRAQAVQVFEKSTTVDRLLLGRSYNLESVVPWYTIRTRDLIGAVVTARLSRPLARTASWPFMAYDTTESSWPTYRVVNHRASVHDVTEIRSFIDLNRN